MSDTPSQPAGWYYAQGDPPNTQRYWDGTQWQGGPQPIASAAPGAAVPGTYAVAGTATPADQGKRFVAFLIDFGIAIGIAIGFAIVSGIGGAIADGLGALLSLLGNLAGLAWGIYNGLYLQGTTGQTIGKKQQGIKLLHAETLQPVGMGMAFVRMLVQGIMWALCVIPGLVDAIFILTQSDRRRFTDKWLTMHVYEA